MRATSSRSRLRYLAAIAFGLSLSARAATPVAVSVSPDSGVGLSQTFTFVYTDADGGADIAVAGVIVNAGFSSANACYLNYYRDGNGLRLGNDAATGQSSPMPLGSAETRENSQCVISGSGSSRSVSGNTLTLNVAITFKQAFAGPKTIYMSATDTAGAAGEWIAKGTWTVGTQNVTPVAVSVSPGSGTGLSQTFTFVYSDGNGGSDIAVAGLIFNAGFDPAGACYVNYYRDGSGLRLSNDAATEQSSVLPLGAAATRENSQCVISGAGSSRSVSGNTLTLSVAVTFKAAFAGQKTIYMSATDTAGAAGDWVSKGSWTVASPPVPPVNVSVTPASGSGSGGTFTFAYRDGNGASDIAVAGLIFNAGFSSASACYVNYYRDGNGLRLGNDAGDGQSSLLPLGSGGTRENSQCVVHDAGSSRTLSGDTLTLTVALSFKPAFEGARSIFLSATDTGGLVSPWEAKGTFQVTGEAARALSIGSGPLCSGQNVTLPVGIVDGAGARSIEFDVVYDPAKVTATAAQASGLASGFAISFNVTTGRVRVAMAGGAGLASATGEVARVSFQGLAGLSSGATATLAIENVRIDDAAGSGGSAILTCADCVRTGDVNGNGAVTALDASLVLQHVVGGIVLSPAQQLCGDVNRNGAVSAFDASLILQCVVQANCP